uniref:Tudor domain-containing protein n=1 Tax=Haptolina brevifila TaxID=156173 RepID=A0A7S2G222_9EUKA|mmetsp:Transcript_24983/g.50202  ORF Transcript_24983/g.50202 Transcript_24983/m.50202 type:complete len:237 (+) Transcript_24983:320-1030(+)
MANPFQPTSLPPRPPPLPPSLPRPPPLSSLPLPPALPSPPSAPTTFESTLPCAYTEAVVGRRVSIQWRGCSGEPWYDGCVVGYGASMHKVRYDDGERKRHNLAKEEAAGQLRWLDERPVVVEEAAGQLKWLDKRPVEMDVVNMSAVRSLRARQPPPLPPPTPLPTTAEERASYDGGVVGRRVSIHWRGDSGEPWYNGRVIGFTVGSGTHTILYDDGEKKRHALAQEEAYKQLKWLD